MADKRFQTTSVCSKASEFCQVLAVKVEDWLLASFYAPPRDDQEAGSPRADVGRLVQEIVVEMGEPQNIKWLLLAILMRPPVKYHLESLQSLGWASVVLPVGTEAVNWTGASRMSNQYQVQLRKCNTLRITFFSVVPFQSVTKTSPCNILLLARVGKTTCSRSRCLGWLRL